MFDYFNGYWRWASENTEKVNPTTTSMYFYILSVANELGWKQSFGLSSTQIMNGIGIATYKTYKKHFDQLVEFGLITIVNESKNQWTCNVLALVNFTIAHTKAQPKHLPKHDQSTTHIHKTIKTIKDYKDLIDNKEYFQNEKLKQTFLDFIQTRIDSKKKPTEKAVELLVKKLGELSNKNPELAIRIIENSIESSWQSFFAIKKELPKDNHSYSHASRNKIL